MLTCCSLLANLPFIILLTVAILPCRSTQQHWPFPGDKTMVGYAYIMTHPGIPCIFWVRPAINCH